MNDIVTGPASAGNNNLCSYNLTTGKIIQDSGITTISVTGGPFLPLAGGIMTVNTGHIDMNISELRNVSKISTATSNILIGIGVSTGGTNNIVVGTNTVSSGTTDSTVLIGRNATATNSLGSVIIGALAHADADYNTCMGSNAGCGTGIENVLIGQASICQGTTYSNTCVGSAAATLTGNECVLIGRRATANANDSVVVGCNANSNNVSSNIIGCNLTNTTSGSLLIAASANIRCDTNGSCDLGTSSFKFKDIYAVGNLISTGTTRSIDNLVTNAGTSTTNNISVFADGTGKIISTGTAAIGTIGALTLANTTDSTSVTTGTIICPGGIGCSKAITAGGIIKTTDSTDSTSTTVGSILTAGGIACVKKIRGGSTLNITTSGAFGHTGTPFSTLECAGILNVTDNGGASVKQLQIEKGTGTSCVITAYQQGVGLREMTLTFRNLAVGTTGALSDGSGIGGIFIENANTVPTTAPTGGGVLYVTGGALKYKGSTGTVTNIAPA